MVVFVLAAAAAYLLCFLLKQSHAPLKSWLTASALPFGWTLFAFLVVALLVMLVAEVAGPQGFGIFLFILVTLSLALGALYVPTTQAPDKSPGQTDLNIPFIEWSHRHVRAVFLIHTTIFALSIFYLAGLRPTKLTIMDYDIPAYLVGYGIDIIRYVAAVYMWSMAIAEFYTLLTQPNNPAFTFWLCSCSVMALVTTMVAWETDAWAYAILLSIRRIASMPEAAQALLGMIAGTMSFNFFRWISWVKANFPQPESEGSGISSSSTGHAKDGAGIPQPNKPTVKAGSDKWPITVFAGALAVVLLVALGVSYAPTAMNRVSGLETPYLKVQFAISPAEKQLVLNMERDLKNIDTLEEFPRSLRFIQYDCALEAVDKNKGMASFMTTPEYKVYTRGLAFRERLIPYVNRVVNATRSVDSAEPAILEGETSEKSFHSKKVN